MELWSGTNLVASALGTNRLTWSGSPIGVHLLSVHLVDDGGNVHTSASSPLMVAPPPEVELIATSTGGFRIGLATLLGRQYQIERTTNFLTWDLVWGPLIATNRSQVWIESSPPDGAAYYRGRILP
jgi:hypothetical protein